MGYLLHLISPITEKEHWKHCLALGNETIVSCQEKNNKIIPFLLLYYCTRIKGTESSVEQFTEETEEYKDKNYQQLSRVSLTLSYSTCV